MERSERTALAEALERENMAEIERAGIAKRIRQARKEAGLSQPEMAQAIGVIERTYQNYESVKNPRTPWGSMNDIAKVTGRSTEWLIHGERTTPELINALSSEEQVSGGFQEFRDHVRELHAHLTKVEQKADRNYELMLRLYEFADGAGAKAFVEAFRQAAAAEDLDVQPVASGTSRKPRSTRSRRKAG